MAMFNSHVKLPLGILSDSLTACYGLNCHPQYGLELHGSFAMVKSNRSSSPSCFYTQIETLKSTHDIYIYMGAVRKSMGTNS